MTPCLAPLKRIECDPNPDRAGAGQEQRRDGALRLCCRGRDRSGPATTAGARSGEQAGVIDPVSDALEIGDKSISCPSRLMLKGSQVPGACRR